MVDAAIRMTKICIVNTTKYKKYAINIEQHYKLILVSEMTYTVSSGTLNSSIPYHTN